MIVEPPSNCNSQDLAALLAATLLSALAGLLLLLTGTLSATALLPATLLTTLSGLLLLLTGTGILLVLVGVGHSHYSSRLVGTLPRAHWIKREDQMRVSSSEKENMRSDRRIRREIRSNWTNFADGAKCELIKCAASSLSLTGLSHSQQLAERFVIRRTTRHGIIDGLL